MLKMQLIGHLGSDANVNQVNGKTVINLNVAHSEKYKDHNGAEVNKTIWVGCAYWTDKTGIVSYLKKGTQIYAEGQPDVKQYTANDGSLRSQITLRVHSIQLLGSSDKSSNSSTPQDSSHSATNIDPIDDLPF